MGRAFVGPQGTGMGLESFPCHVGRGGDGTRQNHAGRGRRPHPSAPPRPIAIPIVDETSFWNHLCCIGQFCVRWLV